VQKIRDGAPVAISAAAAPAPSAPAALGGKGR
jgi:hypothetical protein